MAKVPFSKFGVKVVNETDTLVYTNPKGEQLEYEVLKYLPFKDKTILVSSIINQAADDMNFYNPMKLKLYMTLEIVYAYTNLNFTDKMKEDAFKLYDMLVSSGIYEDIISHMNKGELEEIENCIFDTIDNIYSYKNSVMGILDTVSSDYSNLELDASDIQSKLADPNNLELLRSVLTKLG